jgi:catechol 2,3-dioxygenase-like lactoylglutathione lyase family enzyme
VSIPCRCEACGEQVGSELDLHFDCIFYYVRDLDAAVRFYRDVLGLSLQSEDAVARFDVDGVLFELVPADDDSQLTGDGNARLTFRVDDIERTAAELRERGIEVGDVQRKMNGWLATFNDPDGNELDLWQYASGRD